MPKPREIKTEMNDVRIPVKEIEQWYPIHQELTIHCQTFLIPKQTQMPYVSPEKLKPK